MMHVMSAQLSFQFIIPAMNLFYSLEPSFHLYVSDFPFLLKISFFALVRFIFFDGR